MSSFPVKKHRGIDLFLRESFIGEAAAEGADVALSVRFPDREINVREWSAYLLLIDRFYARLAAKSIYQYAHRRPEQLSVTEIRHGSCQLVLRERVGPGESSTFAALYLLLRNLPNIASVTALLVDQHQLGAYSTVATTRGIRKALRATIPADPLLPRLSTRESEQIVVFLERLYAAEAEHLTPAVRFSSRYVHEVSLQVSSTRGQGQYPLRGMVLHFDRPTDPVAEGEWSVVA